MTDITLSIGGKLSTGDVVGISYMNCVVFGWFVEAGQYGSLKFIDFTEPQKVFDRYANYQNKLLIGAYWDKQFGKGIIFKSFRKDFITTWSATNNRAFKISNPEEFFKDSETEAAYLQGKQILNNIKFPAK